MIGVFYCFKTTIFLKGTKLFFQMQRQMYLSTGYARVDHVLYSVVLAMDICTSRQHPRTVEEAHEDIALLVRQLCSNSHSFHCFGDEANAYDSRSSFMKPPLYARQINGKVRRHSRLVNHPSSQNNHHHKAISILKIKDGGRCSTQMIPYQRHKALFRQ